MNLSFDYWIFLFQPEDSRSIDDLVSFINGKGIGVFTSSTYHFLVCVQFTELHKYVAVYLHISRHL